MGEERQTQAWAVSSGEYSDYSVHCVFERKEDAEEYVRIYNLNATRSHHDHVGSSWKKQKARGRPLGPLPDENPHPDPFEECPNAYCRDGRGGDLTVEPFDFYGPGEIPVVEKWDPTYEYRFSQWETRPPPPKAKPQVIVAEGYFTRELPPALNEGETITTHDVHWIVTRPSE